MLDGHSQLAVMVESHLFGIYKSVADQLGDRFRERSAELAEKMTTSRPLSYLEPKLDVKRIKHRRIATYADLARAFLETWAEQRGKRIWVEKTPVHTLHWHYLREGFPQAKFVAVIRDPRPTALSLVRARFGPSAISDATRRWSSYVDAIDALTRAAPDQVHVVRYESLLAEPEAALTDLCRFVGLEFEDSLLSLRPRVKVVTDPVNRRNLQGELIRSNIAAWRKSMPAYQQRICASLARPWNNWFDLDIEDAAMGTQDRLLDWVDKAKLVVKKARDRQGQAERLDHAKLLLWARICRQLPSFPQMWSLNFPG